MAAALALNGSAVLAQDADWRNVDNIKALLDRCDAAGISTDYEKVSLFFWR